MVDLSQLSDRITNRLSIVHGDNASNPAKEFTAKKIETVQELMDDLDAGHGDSGLVALPSLP